MFEQGTSEFADEQLQEAARKGKKELYQFYLSYRESQFAQVEALRKNRSGARINAEIAKDEPYNAHTVLFFKEIAKVSDEAIQSIKKNIEGCDQLMLADVERELAEAQKRKEGSQKSHAPFIPEEDEEYCALRP